MPYFLKKEFFPNTEVGNKDLSYFRSRLLDEKNSNLRFLVNSRFNWIKDHISKQEIGIELGCGIGASKEVLHDYNYLLTDCYKLQWTDKVVDAMSLPFEDSTFDYILMSNVIHHLACPMDFFDEANRVLKPNGKVIIIDVNCSLFMRFFLKILKHEGYSYDRDPFDRYQNLLGDVRKLLTESYAEKERNTQNNGDGLKYFECVDVETSYEI